MSVSKYESTSSNKSDLDESFDCEPYVVDQVEQVLGQPKLDEMAKKYKLPPFVKLAVIGLGQSTSRPSKGTISLCAKQFESGLTLSFSDIIQVILHRLDLASGQLDPNVWKAIVGCVILLVRERGLPRLVLRSSIAVIS